MRTLAIGDIHGCYAALETLVAKVPIKDSDRVIPLGDYVDRGPDSNCVLQFIMEHSMDGNWIPLRGNHEVMMLDAISGHMKAQNWLACGGKQALESYSTPAKVASLGDIPKSHVWFLQHGLQNYFETETHIFVHASLYPHVTMEEQPEVALFWESFEWISAHESGKTVICGHTSQKTGVPANNGHAICIDTWACGSGWLTCLDVEGGQYWQANQDGEFRSDWLDLD